MKEPEDNENCDFVIQTSSVFSPGWFFYTGAFGIDKMFFLRKKFLNYIFHQLIDIKVVNLTEGN